MFKCKTKTTLSFLAIFVTLLLAGCLDIPDEPNLERQVGRVEVYILQDGISDSTLLKINPSDTASLEVSVYPRQYKKELSFQWFYLDSDSKDTSSIAKGNSYTIVPNKKKIPNLLKATDNENNSLYVKFEVIVNTAPVLSDKTVPADGDTLYGNLHTSFKFEWETKDSETDHADINHTFILDGQQINIGALTTIYQSEISSGKHTFSVIATDHYGDSDTLDTRTFYVLDTLGGI